MNFAVIDGQAKVRLPWGVLFVQFHPIHDKAEYAEQGEDDQYPAQKLHHSSYLLLYIFYHHLFQWSKGKYNMQFREWFTKTADEIFGFDSRQTSLQLNRPYDQGDTLLKPLNFDVLIKELVHLGKVGTKAPRRTFHDHVEWGEQPGAWTADVSPEGSLRITLRKLVTAKDGSPQWICKKVIPLAGQEFSEAKAKEVNIAHIIYNELNTLDKATMLEAPKDYFPEFQRLVIRAADAVRRDHPLIMVQEGIRKVSDTYYIIWHSYRGHGVELPTALRCEQFDINLVFTPALGIIHCWGNEIISRTRQHEWRSRVSRWDEVFMPTQPQEEITDCIVKLLASY